MFLADSPVCLSRSCERAGDYFAVTCRRPDNPALLRKVALGEQAQTTAQPKEFLTVTALPISREDKQG